MWSFTEFDNTLLKSDVTRRDHVSVAMDAGSRIVNLSQIHSRRHSLRITLKYTTLVRMRSSNDHENIQWSEWRLGFNSISWMKHPLRVVLGLWIHTDERMIELEHHTSKQSFTLWNILL